MMAVDSIELHQHLDRVWAGRKREMFTWTIGPIRSTLPRFSVIRVAPTAPTDPWIYVSDGARAISTADGQRLEFVLESAVPDPIHVESLAMVANFHADPRYRIHVGSIIAIGRSWMENSTCDHFLVSVPYPFGPEFERTRVGNRPVRLLWLLPISASETTFAREHGADALEEKFEEAGFDVLDVHRPAVV